MDARTDWKRIEAAAKEQVRGELIAEEVAPLEYGRSIAWSDHRFGRTDGLSPVHRVGFPKGNDPYTSCGEAIPDALRRLALCPGLIRSLGRCRFCEAESARLAPEIAA